MLSAVMCLAAPVSPHFTDDRPLYPILSNCVARLWWSRRAGDNAETMTWQEFQETFQEDVSSQALPTHVNLYTTPYGSKYRALRLC